MFFGQFVFLVIEHDVDLELTPSFPHGPCNYRWNANQKQTRQHFLYNLEPGIELATDRLSDAVHVVGGNAMLQNLKPVPGLFEELAEHVSNNLP